MFSASLTQIKSVEVLIALLATGTLSQHELITKLKTLLAEMQETLACSRAQADHLESQARIVKLLTLGNPGQIRLADPL